MSASGILPVPGISWRPTSSSMCRGRSVADTGADSCLVMFVRLPRSLGRLQLFVASLVLAETSSVPTSTMVMSSGLLDSTRARVQSHRLAEDNEASPETDTGIRLLHPNCVSRGPPDAARSVAMTGIATTPAPLVPVVQLHPRYPFTRRHSQQYFRRYEGLG